MRMRNIIFVVIAAVSTVVNANSLHIRSSNTQIVDSFISEMFPDTIPQSNALWLSAEQRTQLTGILGHAPRTLRIKYRQNANRTLWIFDEIGKVKPITIGVFIRAGEIATIRVLQFRESRGWEIKYSFFTDQFQNIAIDDQLQLTASIDGITGATLSVGAMKRVARAALFLDHMLDGGWDK